VRTDETKISPVNLFNTRRCNTILTSGFPLQLADHCPKTTGVIIGKHCPSGEQQNTFTPLKAKYIHHLNKNKNVPSSPFFLFCFSSFSFFSFLVF